MNEPRPRHRGTYKPGKFAQGRSGYGYRKRHWFLSRLGSSELRMGAVFIPLLGIAAFISDASFKLDDLLKYVGAGALLLGLAWGLHVFGRFAWRFASRARIPRSAASSQVIAPGPWGSRQGTAPSKVLPFELRLPNGVKAQSRTPQLPIVWLVVVGLTGGAIAGGLAFKFIPNLGIRSSTVASSVSFRLCGSSAAENCVVDGDTIHLDAVKVRIADIDTPEIFSPKCSSELALGLKAKGRLLELLNAGPFEVASAGGRDEDIYGRKLRLITRGGLSLGDTLIAEGLARRWDGARRSWC